MNTQIEVNEKFNLDQVAKILLVKDLRTIKDYAEKGLIPKIELGNNSLTIGAQELAEALNVTDFNEKFICGKDAQEILELRTPITEALCLKKGIPFFCLGKGNQGGRKLLFRKSLLIAWLEKSQITLGVDIHWIENLQRERLLSHLRPIFEILAKSTGFGGGRTRLIAKAYFNGATLQEIADETGLTSSRIQQVLQKMNRRMMYTTEKISGWVSNLDEDDYGLVINPQNFLNELESTKNQNLRLKAQLLQAQNLIHQNGLKFSFESNDQINNDVILLEHVSDLEISVRLYNALKAAEIRTLGEILEFSKSDYLKFRNFGKKSLTELEEFVKLKGYELRE